MSAIKSRRTVPASIQSVRRNSAEMQARQSNASRYYALALGELTQLVDGLPPGACVHCFIVACIIARSLSPFVEEAARR